MNKIYTKAISKYATSICIITLVIVGLIFRVNGIQNNHSFWSDEAYVAYVARGVLDQEITIRQAWELTTYQPAYTALVTFSFALFGVSEFSARLPTVIFSSLGILCIFLVGKKLANTQAALLSAFIFAFSQLNLAHATQAKPYAIIQTLLLLEIYILSILSDKTKKRKWFLLSVIISNTLATLLHYIGLLNWIPFLVYLIFSYRKFLHKYLKKPFFMSVLLILFIGFIYLFQIEKIIFSFIKAGKGNIIFTYNHLTYLRELLWRNYAFITLPAIIGTLIAVKKNRLLHIGIFLYIVTAVYLWTFKHYTHNIRYLIPLFGLIFLYFGIFWGYITETFFSKSKYIILTFIVVLLFIGGYKIARKPARYYNPNADLIADIQIADYKTAYKFLSAKYPQLDTYYIVNDWIDTQYWYLKRMPNALFMKYETLGIPYGEKTFHKTTGIPIYTTLTQFKDMTKKYPKGILIVEDWDSFLPEEIKIYAKKNLKREVRVEGLLEAQGDNWPLEIYSWGL